ncbi:V-type ATP synthase subunit I [Candidatus Woesearchaeota archaeon]|nr:V-type ATP synthase subunit I [Candidatus Woesearchaeota archaeon]
MFAPERMKRVTVVGPMSVMDRAVKELYGLKAVHITDHSRGDLELDIGSPLERADRLSELLVTVRAISSALGVSGKKELMNGFRAVGMKNLAGLNKAIKRLNLEVNTILADLKEAEEKLKKLGMKKSQLEFVQKLGLGLDAFFDYRSLACFVGTVKDAQKLRKALLVVTDKFELFSAEEKEKSGFIVALFVESGKKAEAAEVLASAGFAEMPLAEVKGLSNPVSTAIEAANKEKSRLEKRIETDGKALARLSVKWNDFLLLSEQLLAVELEKAEAPLRFAVSKSAFVIRGWVPAGEVETLEVTLNKATGERIFVGAEPPHHSEKVPVKLANPKPAKPFEFFMRLYSLPRYDEIDPTVFTFITFPLFFGFILGDVGYGLVTFFLLFWLKEKFPSASRLVNVLIPAAVSSIIFGFLFGEVFGFEAAFGMEFPRLIGRAHAVNEMMIIAVIIGMVHINLGFVLGFLNELHHKGFFKAFSAKLSWIALELSAALAALSFTGKISLPVYVGGVAAAFFAAMITMAEGFRGPIEIPGLLSNFMSYARLAAVGLSSVILAVVVNDLAKEMAGSGIVGMAGAVITLFVGHTINLALGLLGGFLHSLRLHYVEFFTKFFEGGAIPFRPFGSKTQE